MMKVLLGNLVNVKTGKLDANQADINGKYPFFTCSKEISKINSYSYDCECVLIAGNGDLNVKYYNGKFEAYQRTYILTSIDSNSLSNKYLYWFMNRYIVQLRNQSIGGVIKYIKLGDLTNISLSLPTIDNQRRIVRIFESIERLISKKVFILKALDDLIKSRFVEMFGDLNHNPSYPVVNLKSLIIGSPSNGFFASKELYDKNGKVNLIGVKEVVGNLYTDIYDTLKLNVDESTLKKYLIDYGDMLFCRSSLVKSGIAKASIVPKSNNKSCIFECHTIKIKLNQQLCIPEFMQVQSEQTYFRNQVIKNSKTATMTTISQQGIVDTKVLLPPLSIQQEFTKLLSQINKLKSDVQKSIDETQLLMDSLMQKFFG